MAAASVKARKRSTPHKINQAQALAMHKQGVPISEIATRQGASYQAVWQILQKSAPDQQALTAFKEGRADAFAGLQLKGLALQGKIVDSLLVDGVLDALSPHQKGNLLHSINTVVGTVYDKERLERGQSTANLAVMGRIMGQAHGSLWSDRVTPQESSVQPVEALPPPTPGGGTSEAEQAEGAPDRVPSAENGAPGGTSATPVGNRSRAAKTTNKKRKAT